MDNYIIYFLDTETTGLNPLENEIIEISIYRLNDNNQKTWFIRPKNISSIEEEALRINGHVLDDLLLKTKQGKEKYLEQEKVIADIENWMSDDSSTVDDRILIGQNPTFDKNFLEQLWKNNNAMDTFPFGRKIIDTIQVALLLDLITDNKRKAYNLTSLAKDFEVKLEKAHRADADTRMTKDIWLKQFDIFRKAFKK